MQTWGGLVIFSYVVSLLGAGLYVEASHEQRGPAIRLIILLFWFIYIPISALVRAFVWARRITQPYQLNQRRTI